MSTRNDWIKVTLAVNEIASAQAEARRRGETAERERLRPRGGPRSREADLLGCLGEAAVAKYLGIPSPSGDHRDDHRRGYDVGGWQVRTRGKPHYGLLIYQHETSGVWVVVLGHQADQGILHLAGWISAAAAWRHAVKRQDRGDPYFTVDQEHLVPLPPVIREAA